MRNRPRPTASCASNWAVDPPRTGVPGRRRHHPHGGHHAGRAGCRRAGRHRVDPDVPQLLLELEITGRWPWQKRNVGADRWPRAERDKAQLGNASVTFSDARVTVVIIGVNPRHAVQSGRGETRVLQCRTRDVRHARTSRGPRGDGCLRDGGLRRCDGGLPRRADGRQPLPGHRGGVRAGHRRAAGDRQGRAGPGRLDPQSGEEEESRSAPMPCSTRRRGTSSASWTGRTTPVRTSSRPRRSARPPGWCSAGTRRARPSWT